MLHVFVLPYSSTFLRALDGLDHEGGRFDISCWTVRDPLTLSPTSPTSVMRSSLILLVAICTTLGTCSEHHEDGTSEHHETEQKYQQPHYGTSEQKYQQPQYGTSEQKYQQPRQYGTSEQRVIKRGAQHHQQVQVNHVTKHVPYHVPQPVPHVVIKKVPYPVPKPYPVAVPRPYKVQVPIKVPFTIEKPYPITVEKPYPVHVPVKVPVNVPRPYPVHVEKPYPVHVPIKVPQPVKVPVYVPKPVYLKKGQNHEQEQHEYGTTGFTDFGGDRDLDTKFDFDTLQFDSTKIKSGNSKVNFKQGSVKAPTFQDILEVGGYSNHAEENFNKYKELLQNSNIFQPGKNTGAGNLKDYGVTENTDQFGHVDLSSALNLNHFKLPSDENQNHNFDSTNLKLLGNFDNGKFNGGKFDFKQQIEQSNYKDGSAVQFPADQGYSHQGLLNTQTLHGGTFNDNHGHAKFTVAKYVKTATSNRDVSTPQYLPAGGKGFSHDGGNKVRYYKRATTLPKRFRIVRQRTQHQHS
ncbi:hypothetical protein B566_EDAN017507 [Ephemera danica]|nr:hypothetical protein B566_EDAN017507 [Ephemera danica]